MKTDSFPLQKKLKSHLRHNPPPSFVGNFRTSSPILVSSMVTQEGSVCMNIYDLSLCLYVYILHSPWTCMASFCFTDWNSTESLRFWCLLEFLAPNYLRKILTCIFGEVFFFLLMGNIFLVREPFCCCCCFLYIVKSDQLIS